MNDNGYAKCQRAYDNFSPEYFKGHPLIESCSECGHEESEEDVDADLNCCVECGCYICDKCSKDMGPLLCETCVEGWADDLDAEFMDSLDSIKSRYADVLDMVAVELMKVEKVHPEWPLDPLHAIGILQEEVGELTKDVLQMVYEPEKTSMNNINAEAVQVGAMAFRFLLATGTYEFKESKQITIL